jgi:hypothetical protein
MTASDPPRPREGIGPDAAGAGHGKVRSPCSWLLWVTAAILLALFLARVDDWLYRNEAFNNLAMGFDIAPDHPALVALSEAGLANCENNSVEDLRHCHLYQNIITQNLYFAEPVQAFFGTLLADGYGETPWLLAVHRAAVWAQITTALLAVALWLVFTAALPSAYRASVSAATLILVMMGYLRRGDLTFVLPDPIESGVQAWEAPAMIALVAALLWVLPRAAGLLNRPPAARAVGLLAADRRSWLLLAAMILVQMVLPMFLKPLVQGAALALLFLLLVREVKNTTVDPRYLLIAVVLLLVLVSGDGSILLRKLEVPRYAAFLVFGAAMAYIAARPRGWLILLLPVIVVFHASVAALCGLALVCAELPILLVRRKPSPALLAGLLTFGCGMLITFGFETDLLGISGEAVRRLAELLWAQPWHLLSLIVTLALIAGLTLWPLLSQSPENDDLVRVGILTMQAIVFATIHELFMAFDPALRAMPGYYTLVHTGTHLNPGLTFGASLSLVVSIGRYYGGFRQTAGTAGRDSLTVGPFVRKLTVLILLIGIVNLNFKPRPFLIDTVNNLVTYAVLERIHPNWCRYLQDASRLDDHYVFSAEKPTNGPENYFSVLKLKTRIAAGVYDPDRMTIGNAPVLAANDDDSGPEPQGFERFWKLVREHFSARDCT